MLKRKVYEDLLKWKKEARKGFVYYRGKTDRKNNIEFVSLGK